MPIRPSRTKICEIQFNSAVINNFKEQFIHIKTALMQMLVLSVNNVLLHGAHSFESFLECVHWQSFSLRWRHNERNGVSNHQPHHYLFNRLFRRKSKKTSKLRVTVFCAGNSPVTGEFPAQRASNAENISIWWRHHVTFRFFIHLR